MSESSIPLYTGGRRIMENDVVVMWEDVFQPGALIGPHRHERDYIIVALDAGRLTMTPVGGEPETIPVAAGEAVYIAVSAEGHAHTAVHEGDAPHREIVIELKGRVSG